MTTTLTAEANDLRRFLTGRSTRSLIEEYEWNRDPAPILDLGLPFPFEFRREG